MSDRKVFSPDSVQWAYCILHQKLRVYQQSNIPAQRDEIENVVSSYVMQMDRDLYDYISGGNPDYLMEHSSFGNDLADAVDKLGKLMNQ